MQRADDLSYTTEFRNVSKEEYYKSLAIYSLYIVHLLKHGYLTFTKQTTRHSAPLHSSDKTF